MWDSILGVYANHGHRQCTNLAFCIVFIKWRSINLYLFMCVVLEIFDGLDHPPPLPCAVCTGQGGIFSVTGPIRQCFLPPTPFPDFHTGMELQLLVRRAPALPVAGAVSLVDAKSHSVFQASLWPSLPPSPAQPSSLNWSFVHCSSAVELGRLVCGCRIVSPCLLWMLHFINPCTIEH